MKWLESPTTLTHTWKFDDYSAAWAFAEKATTLFNQHNHHPDMLIKWGEVTITTTTHDAGNKVTEKDYKLAKALDEIS